MSGNRSAGIGVLSLPDEVLGRWTPRSTPPPTEVEVRGNVARGNGFDPDPRLPLPPAGCQREWLVEGS